MRFRYFLSLISLLSTGAIPAVSAQTGYGLHIDTVFSKNQLSDSPFKRPLRFSNSQLYPPVGLMLSGLLSNENGKESLKMEIAEERNEHFPHFRTHVDDYLQFAPIATVYALDAFGYKARHDILTRSAILIKGELLMTAVVFSSKRAFRNLRPDNSAYDSFPSGHTAQAFAAATFLAVEYGSTYKWMPYAAYGVASCVGSLRIVNNRHYISDVLMGAGIGILTMKAAYWTHDRLKRRKNR